MRHRRSRPLFVIDIALPRDVESEVGNLEQVFLYNIDDLQSIVKENLARRNAELTSAEAIIEDEVGKFAAWMQSREIIPTVVALRSGSRRSARRSCPARRQAGRAAARSARSASTKSPASSSRSCCSRRPNS